MKINKFWQNQKLGPLVVDVVSGALRHRADCNIDIFGNYRAKAADKVIIDPTREKSKFRRGLNWSRSY